MSLQLLLIEGEMVSYIWSNGGALSLVVAMMVSGVIGLIASQTCGGKARSAVRATAITLPIAAILSFTLVRGGWPTDIDPRRGFTWAPFGWMRFSTEIGTSQEIWFNVVLFVPAALLLTTVAAQRPLRILVALAALSAAVEVIQGTLQIGSPDLSDVLANSLGSLIGVLLGSAAAYLGKWTTRPSRSDLAVLVVLSAVLIASIPLGAALRQHQFEKQAMQRFRGQTLEEYQEWAANDELETRVFSMGGTFSSGAYERKGMVVVRYPTSFMGITQCVTVTWTVEGNSVAGKSGNACTTFLG